MSLPYGLKQSQLDRALESSPVYVPLPYWDVDDDEMPSVVWSEELLRFRPGNEPKCECVYAECPMHGPRKRGHSHWCQNRSRVIVHEWNDVKTTRFMCWECAVANGLYRDTLIITEEL